MDGMDARSTASAPEQGAHRVWKRRILVLMASAAVVAVCVAIRAIGGRTEVSAQNPRTPGGVKAGVPQSPAKGSPRNSAGQELVATVNGREITRGQLAQECLAGYGNEVLEAMVNKYLIINHCEQHGIKVTRQEIDAEIERLAQKFGIPVEQWLTMLKQERGISPEQYANDIIWPTLALRELAEEQVRPTEQELQEAFEARYGEAVRARIIVLDDLQLARQIHAQLQADPAQFDKLARKHSIDPTSASMNGLIQPIRKHVGDPQIEQAAFSLQNGQISPVLEVNKQFVILKCEGRTQPQGYKMETVRSRLEEFVRERKMRGVAGELFKKLQQTAKVENIYNNPQKRAKMPGVAALVNGRQVTIQALADECVQRHGEEVLRRMIDRTMLEEELERHKLIVQEQHLDAEIARAAIAAGKIDPNTNRPDVDAWLKVVVEEQGVPEEHYIRDSVWPSAALKLLAGEVEVTQEDIERGYAANYGARARVRAIVLENARRAQEVWQKARDNPTAEYFGQLASEYSVEPASRANEGRVPPLQQYGGQPDLEREAFSLKPGEISGIIQVSNRYIILFLEGFTEPVEVSLDEVRDLIYEDIHEKKQRVEMAAAFEALKDRAFIHNYLAGTTHRPKPKSQENAAESAPGILPRQPAGQSVVPANHQKPHAGGPPTGGNGRAGTHYAPGK